MKLLFLLFSATKWGKFLLPGSSILISVLTYSYVYGWKYAVGFVLLILIHEMGHFIAAKNRGLKASLPMFIPFVGAWIKLKDQPVDAETEAFIALAGPMLGSFAAFICYLIAKNTGTEVFMALALAGFVLNLINLIPVALLDGGKVMAVVSPKFWWLGLLLLIALLVWKPNFLVGLIIYFAIRQMLTYSKDRKNSQNNYYTIPNSIKFNYGVHYFLLVFFLLFMIQKSYQVTSAF